MNILILAAGDSNRAAGSYPIWLSEMNGQLLIERQALAFSSAGGTKFIFAFRQDDIDAHHVDAIIEQLTPGASIVSIKRDTAGAACTALLAIGHMDSDKELVVISATDFIDADYAAILEGYRRAEADAGIMTFESLHPRYSFVRTDHEGLVVEAAEKRPISRQANAGFYWFAKAGDFTDALRQMILKDAHVNGVFYISPALNELVLKGRKIVVHHLDASQYHPLKDQRQLDVMEHRLEEKTRHAS